jgi:hypothetical protein
MEEERNKIQKTAIEYTNSLLLLPHTTYSSFNVYLMPFNAAIFSSFIPPRYYSFAVVFFRVMMSNFMRYVAA